jgi:hypothetical protein
MKAIAIDPSSRRLGTCRSCGAVIEWAQTLGSQAAIPFNAPIVLLPSLRFDDQEEPAVARVDMTRTTSHFSNCPQADEWRRHRRSRP